MAGQRFWSRVLGKRYAPSRRSQPLFLERRLDSLPKGSKYNRWDILAVLIRTLRINAFTEEPAHNMHDLYPQTAIAVQINPTGAGINTLIIQPPLGEVWLLDRVGIDHSDNVARVFNTGIVDLVGAFVVPLYSVGHVSIIADAMQVVYPTFDEEAGNTHHHIASIIPQQLDFEHYYQAQGLGFNADEEINMFYMYRRIK